jgi:hypothetical protein
MLTDAQGLKRVVATTKAGTLCKLFEFDIGLPILSQVGDFCPSLLKT